MKQLPPRNVFTAFPSWIAVFSLVFVPGLAFIAAPPAADAQALPADYDALLSDALPADAVRLEPVEIDGLRDVVKVRRDQYGVPHIIAGNDHDALFTLGWVHAEDRFFQMELLRRTFSGTLAELVGQDALPQDVQFRTLGLRRGAEESVGAVSQATVDWLIAYSEGVNAYLAATPALPPEYAALRLTKASVPAWTPVDSVVIAKGLSFGLSFSLDDIDLTEALLTFQSVGGLFGFDGRAFFFNDLFRTAPFDPAVSIPDFFDDRGNPRQNTDASLTDLLAGTAASLTFPSTAGRRADMTPAGTFRVAPGNLPPWAKGDLPDHLGERTLALIRKLRSELEEAPAVERLLRRREAPLGSNWWMVSGEHTESGFPILANDPHLGLDTPAIFYEAQIRVTKRGDDPFMNVFGTSFAGTPGVILGCTAWICWGATTNPLDVTDVYQEEIVVDPVFGPTHTVFEGELEPLTVIPQTYRLNAMDPDQVDLLVDSGIGIADPGGLTLLIPRRNNGPIIVLELDEDVPGRAFGLSVQYTGWRATREVEAIRSWARAKGIPDFAEGLENFDVGSQNWAVADVAGNIAYFTSAELPLRTDLENFGFPAGLPPYFVRDGTDADNDWLPVETRHPGQSLDYEILPPSEMPRVVNPASGYVLNCNNDPVGVTLDNNPLSNRRRPGGGIYYLSPGYATGFRMGRIQRLIDDALAGGGKVTVEDLKAFQANNQLLDAEVFVPYIVRALNNAVRATAGPELGALGADSKIIEAVERLAAWDWSTPTGIPEGYDPGDDPENLPEPTQEEIDASVAATIYAAWRGPFIANTIDIVLEELNQTILDFMPELDLELPSLAPGSSQALAALRFQLDNFATLEGQGSSGVQFFFVPGVEDPATARDIVILQSVREALDLLAGDDFATAFANSTDQNDYRWGRLHRIVFEHPLGGPFNLPGAGGLEDLADGLPGVARSGGLGALDASSHGARADSENDFMFDSGPARRFIGHMFPTGPMAEEVIPGGESGVLGSPRQTDQLMLWLTNGYKPLHRLPSEVIEATATLQELRPGG